MAPTLYFAYGSNLWMHQMAQRCPTSAYLGSARLKGYRWIIYERGYANIVEINHKQTESGAYADEVWGLVFSLQPSDVRKLDINPDEKPKQVEMLVYINRRMTTPSKPKKEYIYRMNQGIKDALKEGMPLAYVDAVMRKFIPNVEDEEVAEVAKKQALVFEEE
ncbi:hypothetical protein LTR91_018517 [Friedmanniomyces endolithicus]|uniref:gamma-glutamylcyclotransferase n=1 Tax=Friedmanniomyces endolithicus TaxID=329885 RepID=A0AAN6K2T8_9PEZI|nr:hypothetical protein LTR57_012833 [Friedmanniomyces endolithicus]KAK0964343.1 hypothetical protein LTR91_018517 [Friedmanniomyces endolithicus]KAK0967777.1 hypothetical protein LTS01_017073 [Friedmanniomyces endolithicus]KAK1037397.1 hypothetical protein LTS16_012945 [Friedmanniomyces endolithicus]